MTREIKSALVRRKTIDEELGRSQQLSPRCWGMTELQLYHRVGSRLLSLRLDLVQHLRQEVRR